MPRPGEFGYDTWPKDACKYVGGTNNWGEMTIDTQRGIAYIPLGTPTYDFYGADRVGANLSIVALEARTAQRLWHFQFVHHDLWDLDPSAAPQLTTIRHNGRNRDVAAEVDNVVNFVTTPASGRGARRGSRRRARRGSRRIGCAARAHCRFRIGVGKAGSGECRSRAGRREALSRRRPRLHAVTINEYNTVGNRIKPPFTVIGNNDLNQPGIKWRIPYGDDPELAARGITGTSVPGIQNSIIVTESGLVFGAGRDNFIRAWDSDAGKQLWASRFGGNFTGSPAMYEMGGKQYLLVPAAGAPAGGRGAGAGPAAPPAVGPQSSASAPRGWVAYTLPSK